MPKKLWKIEKLMLRFEEEKIYSKLSLIYDYVMRNVNYHQWVRYVHDVVKDYISQNAQVLELGSGNCKFANRFKRYYPNLIVTDLSKNMLLNDKKNILPRICCDMTKLPFKTKFDLIYSTFDSVNYLLNKQKLFSLFKGVANVLDNEGIFAFDASLENNSLAHASDPEREGIYKSISYKQKSIYNKQSRIHKNIFSITFNNKVYYEVHKQKIYKFEDYFELIENSGMFVTECYNAFSFDNGTPESDRVQFLVRKSRSYAGI
jgi:SAM-dependent methyltransferase